MIKISVVIPVYNRQGYIRECLDSVLGQTLKEIEIICIDDGSTDCTYDILMDYCRKHTNIVVLHQDNQGAGSARNRGIEHARGKYICFMDSDDYYAEDCALEHLYESAEKEHVSVCGGNLYLCWQNGKMQRSSKWFAERRMLSFREYGFTFNYTAYIFRLKLIREKNIAFPPYRRFEDPPFFLKVMAYARDFYAIDDVIYIYRHGHKETSFSLDMAIDLLRGVRDCFELAKENGFTRMYDEYFKNILCIHLWIIYPYNNQKRVWELINRINEINMEWMNEYPEMFDNRNSLESYVVTQRRKRKCMISECSKAKQIVIYGAGEAGRYFIENYGKYCPHVIGFAVSKKGKTDVIEGYDVREIGEYSRTTLVIVAVKKRFRAEILEILERMQFNNRYCMDYEALQIIEKL